MKRLDEQEALWTSTQVAEALGVGVSSIKRWTDDGILESVRTVGGHRRYRLESIHGFARARNLPIEKLPPIDVLIDPNESSPHEIVKRLLSDLDKGRVGAGCLTMAAYLGQIADRTAFMDQVLGELLIQIGNLWADGTWSVEKEHRSSYCIAESLDRARQPEPSNGPLAILACPPGEAHSLPLNMLRFLLSENRWRSDFIGADVPWDSLEDAAVRQKARLVLLTARSDVPFNSPQFAKVATACRKAGATVCVGGGWARGGSRRAQTVRRFRTLAGFERWLRSTDL